MFQEMLIKDRPTVDSLSCLHYDESVNVDEILKVLSRAADDNDFLAQMTYRGSEALQNYNLTSQEKAALLSGDIRWIEARVGKLGSRLSTWLNCRLQQEIW